MEIPTPDEFAKAHGFRPFPGKWARWLNTLREEILTAQPVAGRHVTVDEHPGKGTVINVLDTSGRRTGGRGGECPSTMTMTFTDIVVDCGCVFAPQPGSYIDVTDIACNSTYHADQSDPCQFFPNDEDFPIVHAKERCDETCETCSDDFNDTQGLVVFFTGGFWRVWYQPFTTGGNATAFLFYAKVAGTIDSPPATTANQLTACNSTPWDDDPDFDTLYGRPASDAVAVGHGGSLAISFT